MKKSNPGIQFKDIGRVLGERWNKMTGIHQFHFPFLVLLLTIPLSICVSVYINKPIHVVSSAEEKAPYEAKARADKKRYSEEISGYKNPQPMLVDSPDASDSD